MSKIGLLGCGTVGTGVYEIINERKGNFFEENNYKIKKILVRDASRKREGIPGELLTDNPDDILNDDEISLIIAVMGSYEQEYPAIKKALQLKKNVVTANKEIISKHMEELLGLAKENGVTILFEASVGGGIPIIESIIDTIKINKINKVQGILNGTTNFILSKMTKEELDFDEVLKVAQDMGFAEADPTADVDGFDISRKLTILSSLCYGAYIDNDDIYTRTVRNITLSDIQAADDFGYVFKYMAESELYDDNTFGASVTPVLIGKDSVTSNVNDEYNVVSINGNIIGQLSFLGRGAGKEATANAVVADVIKVLTKSVHDYTHLKFENEYKSCGIERYKNKFYLRVSIKDEVEFAKTIDIVYRNIENVNLSYEDGKVFLITDELTGEFMSTLCDRLSHVTEDVFYARIIDNIL
ncbi:homoserine dehydrogenase [Anaerofustis stercorihominis]|uniref:Homoserine dehydrogenase n=2 Tax=Anaerofustis stercorihominis TaxID=214853 RepID=B1C8K0_9FIRM|nr:homoserine dehydrogenase [Anaerofustis stercorihominis]EDS71910.1 homoserine dehydrogenase [Anaerofustis stercorihominis DSM 17244]MCQ4796056.1 homoserine dehydrogenase [Anaerofustis stercorihominis]